MKLKEKKALDHCFLAVMMLLFLISWLVAKSWKHLPVIELTGF
jgi:hypothetical protein